jgi:hypothetical protein
MTTISVLTAGACAKTAAIQVSRTPVWRTDGLTLAARVEETPRHEIAVRVGLVLPLRAMGI